MRERERRGETEIGERGRKRERKRGKSRKKKKKSEEGKREKWREREGSLYLLFFECRSLCPFGKRFSEQFRKWEKVQGSIGAIVQQKWKERLVESFMESREACTENGSILHSLMITTKMGLHSNIYFAYSS